jgi:hypothetical protein
VARLRAENAKRRVANRELDERNRQLLADLEAERQQRAEAQRVLDENRAALEQAQATQKRLLEETATANQAVIDSLPVELRGVVPTDYEPSKLRHWLDANVNLLRNRLAPPSDGAAGSSQDRNNDAPAIGADEAALARALGIDPSQLVKELRAGRQKSEAQT